jgi:hypothetical protein
MSVGRAASAVVVAGVMVVMGAGCTASRVSGSSRHPSTGKAARTSMSPPASVTRVGSPRPGVSLATGLLTAADLTNEVQQPFTSSREFGRAPYIPTPFQQCGVEYGFPGGLPIASVVAVGFHNQNQLSPTLAGESIVRYHSNGALRTMNAVRTVLVKCPYAHRLATDVSGNDALLSYTTHAQPTIGTNGLYQAVIRQGDFLIWLDLSARTENAQPAMLHSLIQLADMRACKVLTC